MEAREVAFKVLLDVEKGAYANLILDDYLRKYELSSLDRAFVTELVYNTIKHQLSLDWIIQQLVKKEGKLEQGPRILLRLALYQLVFLDKIPPSAATNEAVKLAKKRFHSGVAGLINGVLRNYLRDPGKIVWPDQEEDPLSYLEVVYSHPRWMVERWLKRYGFLNTEKLCQFNNKPAPLWIRTNILRCTPQELETRLTEEGCTLVKSSRIPEGFRLEKSPPLTSLESFQKGLFTVQDESSMLVGHVVHPSPELELLDVCAGPGGKTTHLAELMGNTGLIISCDVHEHRLGLIRENAKRLGINIIKTILQDATKISVELVPNQYDIILVDAPCSGLGVLRRRPDSRWRKNRADIINLSKLQKQILDSVLKVLKPGGRLIYSTCTIEPEENHQVIRYITDKYPQVKTISLEQYLPFQADNEQERREMGEGMVQYLPFRDNMDGFFIAGLVKEPS